MLMIMEQLDGMEMMVLLTIPISLKTMLKIMPVLSVGMVKTVRFLILISLITLLIMLVLSYGKMKTVTVKTVRFLIPISQITLLMRPGLSYGMVKTVMFPILISPRILLLMMVVLLYGKEIMELYLNPSS